MLVWTTGGWVPFLGHLIGSEGIRPDPAKTAAIQGWTTPRSVKEVQGYLGFANWFRHYLQGYSQQVASLTRLTKKNVLFNWTPDCEKAFQWIKKALQSAPVLALPDFEQPFEVRSDASGSGVGAVLMQNGRPVAYESAAFAPVERNYTIGEQELLAVVFALRKWRAYLEGSPHPVKIVTDHQPLTYLPTKGTLGSRQVSWSEYLARFHLEWVHTPGLKNVADALSRMPCLTLYVTTRSRAHREKGVAEPTAPALATEGSQMCPRANGTPRAPSPVSTPTCRKAKGAAEAPSTEAATEVTPTDVPAAAASEQDDQAQINQDQFLAELRGAYQGDAWLKDKHHRKVLRQHHDFWWRGDALYIPEEGSLRHECIRNIHDHPFSGHVGMKRTEELLRRLYWWPSCQADVNRYVQICESCQRNKPTNVKPAGLLQPLPIPGRPWASVGIDFITHLPVTKFGHTAIFVCVDRCSKMVHLVPTSDKVTAAETAKLFIDNVVKLHGVPEDFVSDRDARFTGKFWEAFCEQMGIDRKMSTAFHPETDGQTEGRLRG